MYPIKIAILMPPSIKLYHIPDLLKDVASEIRFAKN